MNPPSPLATVHGCVAWAVVFGLIGFAGVAWAQAADPTAPPMVTTQTSELDTLIHLVSGGGLPAVLAFLGWLAGRSGGIPIAPITVRLSDEDRAELRKWRRREDDSDDSTPEHK